MDGGKRQMTMDKIKKDIMIRGLQNKIWMKFRALCKEQEYSANYGVKKLIREYVEKSGGEKWI